MFPGGMESFRACVDKIHKAGLKLGVHTLSTFITEDDHYVTMENPDLARTQGSHGEYITRGYGKKVYYPNGNWSAEIAVIVPVL